MDQSKAVDDEKLLETITARIVQAIQPQKVILFGSWARGERGRHSDIDLLIVHDSSLPRPQRYAQVRRLFWGMGLPMDILVYTPEECCRVSLPRCFAVDVSGSDKGDRGRRRSYFAGDDP